LLILLLLSITITHTAHKPQQQQPAVVQVSSVFNQNKVSSVMASSMFSIGAKVQTHSLTAAEYNGLVGVVTGAAVEKNGVMRVPVRLELSNGEKKKKKKKSVMLQLKNLLCISPAFDLELQQKLYDAVIVGSVKAFRKYVKMGTNINIPNENGCTPVFMAAHEGHVDVIRVLFQLGANVNTADQTGSTPVYIAA
jgi:hypothetical protein